LSGDDETPGALDLTAIDPVLSRYIFLTMLALMALGFLAFRMLSKPVGPPPPEIAGDALLTKGREIYLVRCANCHGNEGRGNGPIAKSLLGPPVGNLTDNEWKHGDKPDQVLDVISRGVPNTRMDGWGRVLDPPDLKAVAGYVYYLAKRQVPEELRKP
jgi:cytochrome c oxidase cbb3-type subunit III